MIELLQRCFPRRFKMDWQETLRVMMPTYGTKLNDDAELFQKSLSATAASLQLK